MSRLHRKGELSLEELLDDVKKCNGADKIGAVVVFVGVVRGIDSGVRVEKLEYEAYEEVANREIIKIEEDLKKKYGLVEIKIHHFIDVLYPGEDVVYVVAASEHRKEAFKAAEDAIDILKEKVPIWKKEFREDGALWKRE